METKRFLFSGNVQGVGFRFVTKEKAKKLNLKGWVKNLADGKVEAVFQGENIERIIKELKESFSIEKVEAFSFLKDDFEDFQIIL